MDIKRIFMSCLVPLVLVGCSKGIGENGASSDASEIPTSTSLLNGTTTLVSIDPYANEDLVWIADTCEAEQKTYGFMIDASRTADNPDIAGQELDFLDFEAVKSVIKNWQNAWNDLNLALQTVGQTALGLSARENAGLGYDGRTPGIMFYYSNSSKWFYPLNLAQEDHEDVAHYCSMLPPRPLSISADPETEVVYQLGDTGPGGGIIIYVDEAGFDNSSGDETSIGAMCLKARCNYLEIAPTDLEGLYSWDDAIVVSEAFSTAAANDWTLPSKGALNEMCKYAFGDTRNRICNAQGNDIFTNSFGNFSRDNYWSASEFDINYSWIQNFYGGGYQGKSPKHHTSVVRPVRVF